MTEARLFRSNRSQAVRLPKEVAFPEDVEAVRIIREGNRRILVPADTTWDDFFDEPGCADFPDRVQSAAQEREPL